MIKSEDFQVAIKCFVKRVMDLVILFCFAPVWVPVSLIMLLGIVFEQLVYRDFGPPIISEIRISKGRKFRLYKLNMYKESARKKYILECNGYRVVCMITAKRGAGRGGARPRICRGRGCYSKRTACYN